MPLLFPSQSSIPPTPNPKYINSKLTNIITGQNRKEMSTQLNANNKMNENLLYSDFSSNNSNNINNNNNNNNNLKINNNCEFSSNSFLNSTNHSEYVPLVMKFNNSNGLNSSGNAFISSAFNNSNLTSTRFNNPNNNTNNNNNSNNNSNNSNSNNNNNIIINSNNNNNNSNFFTNSNNNLSSNNNINNNLNTSSIYSQNRYSVNFQTNKNILVPINSSNKVPVVKTKRSGSITSLLPLRENNSSHSLAPTPNLTNTNTNQLTTTQSINMSLNRLKNKNQQIDKTKKRKSNSLSIMDYCNIINMNTNYQMLTNFYEDSEETLTRLSLKPNRNNQTIQPSKPINIPDQMAALFGSSACTCYLCKMKPSFEIKKYQQYNIEITPNKNHNDFSITKYTYSTPFSQLSTLKLFNLMNTDCSIYYTDNQSKSNYDNAIVTQTANLTIPNTGNNFPSNYNVSNHTTTLPSIVNPANNSPPNISNINFQTNSNITVTPCPTTTAQNYMHVNSNNPPIYDLRYLYIIDCRLNKKKFERSRIHTSIHFTDLLNDVVYLSTPSDNYTIIVLYDDDGTFLASSNHATNQNLDQFYCNSISTFNSNSASFDKDRQITNSDLLITKIKSKLNCSANRTFHILSGGFDQFYNKFPFMCSNLEIRSTVDRHKYLTIYPNCVIENQIYIGSGIQAKNWKIIRDLRITHIVNCSIEHECVFQDEIKYLHVKIEDSHEENIYKIFNKTHNFMQEAFENYYEELARYNDQNSDSGSGSTSGSSSATSSVTNLKSNNSTATLCLLKTKPQPPVILVHCNLGISRSSSVLIAYLIKRYNMCLYAAFNYVKDKRLQIAPNYSFLRQLKQFEEVNCYE